MLEAINIGERIVAAGVFTLTSYITCNFRMRQSRLLDFLNSLEEHFIMVDNVSIVPLGEAEAKPKVSAYAQLNRDLIVFAIPYSGESLAESGPERRLVYVPKFPYRVTLSAPPFLFHGTLHLIRETSLRDALLSMRLPFLPMTDAVAIYLPTGRRYIGNTLIINRSRIETFCPMQPGEEENWSRLSILTQTTI